MKHILVATLMLISFFSQAKQASGSFGYQIEIPATWSPLTSPEIRDNPDLFDFNKLDGKLTPAVLEQMIPMVKAGQIDIYFLPDNSNDFADNINVMK